MLISMVIFSYLNDNIFILNNYLGMHPYWTFYIFMLIYLRLCQKNLVSLPLSTPINTNPRPKPNETSYLSLVCNNLLRNRQLNSRDEVVKVQPTFINDLLFAYCADMRSSCTRLHQSGESILRFPNRERCRCGSYPRSSILRS